MVTWVVAWQHQVEENRHYRNPQIRHNETLQEMGTNQIEFIQTAFDFLHG